MKLQIPSPSLVVLVGASGSGKSSFARKHFLPTQVISSDYCRGLVSDDENAQWATKPAFEVLHYIAAKRMEGNRLTVIDATNVQKEARKSLVTLARDHDFLPVAIVFNMPEKLCQARNATRPDRDFGKHVIPQQVRQLKRSLRALRKEGFRQVLILDSEEVVDAAEIEYGRLYNNREEEHGPFDIVGDIHGCFDELCSLLERLGYRIHMEDTIRVEAPVGRKVLFVGDLVDRGPKIPEVLRLVMVMCAAGKAICVPGNHDVKLVRMLEGHQVKMVHGLEESAAQLERESPAFREAVRVFLKELVSHYVLDGGRLVLAHAGMKEAFQGRASGRVRSFALYGETTGETDEFGLPVRYPWAEDYRGRAMVVYGHTPVLEPEWVNNTVNIDTGCVFGGKLTALRYPEKEFVSVPAAREYCAPVKPLRPPAEARQRDLLDIGDVTGKRGVETRLRGRVTVRAENAAAALEVMSRFAVNPRWLIYLPPTMSPSETSEREGYLEYPEEAFAYYRKAGVEQVVCQEKHMGSRTVVVVCRSEEVAARRFGVGGEGIGAIYTRTGRPFFNDPSIEAALLEVMCDAATQGGLWESLETDWLCLDCELMPWSAKAAALLRSQYAATAAAAEASLPRAVALLKAAAERGVALDETGQDLLARYQSREAAAKRFREAYRHYCWDVDGIEGIRIAPFHVMAGEEGVNSEQSHRWHMEQVDKLVAAADSPLLQGTHWKSVDVTDNGSIADACAWWREITGVGGEGMVIKPLGFTVSGAKGLVQPALKCRGPEYLRIIYGPEYLEAENLLRLRKRGLGRKRSLALREFAMGIEALERFVKGAPLYQVHECVFGVLAMESESVDPRL